MYMVNEVPVVTAPTFEDWINRKYDCNISIKYDYNNFGNTLLVNYVDGIEKVIGDLQKYCDNLNMKLSIERACVNKRVPLYIKPLSEYEF